MKKLLVLFVLVLFGTTIYSQNVTVTVKMGVQVAKGNFVIGTDTVVIRGNFQAAAGDPGGDWQGTMFKLTNYNAADTSYSQTFNFPAGMVGNNYEFKFVKAPDGWEGGGNRPLPVATGTTVLPTYWFSNDSTYPVGAQVTNTINFVADLSLIFGSGVGFFDPNQDSIIVAGLDWDGLGTVISGERKLAATNPLQPKIFRTSMTIQGIEGDSTKWKFRAYPETRFTNTGWETGNDRWFKYVADGSTVTLDPIQPRIYPSSGPLTAPSQVLFQVNMTNAVNHYNNSTINPATLIFVGLKGGSEAIGNWGGNWVVSDTTVQTNGYPYITKLNDSGLNGDKVAGDNIWSTTVSFPVGAGTGAIEYKFAAYYPGADTVNGGTAPLDNEGGFGENHLFILRESSTVTELTNIFGDFTTSIKENPALTPDNFSLLQNFPNPFNPATTISFTVPQDGIVTLKIYNMMGEEVGTLMNNFQPAGGYDVTFDASRLASGVYFYTLTTGNFTATKKMMLLK